MYNQSCSLENQSKCEARLCSFEKEHKQQCNVKCRFQQNNGFWYDFDKCLITRHWFELRVLFA